eukprot:3515256-Pyramimonas_sp.AAC.1
MHQPRAKTRFLQLEIPGVFFFTLRVHLQPWRLTLHLERIYQGLDRLAVGLNINELYCSLGGHPLIWNASVRVWTGSQWG